VAATGGGFTMANTAAQTVTISGNVTGSGPLAFQSTLAGGGTFLLSGNNSGYSGDIGVTNTSTGLTTLTIANQAAAPASGSITVNYPPAGANGNANTLSLPNISLPAAVGLNLTSLTSGTLSLRSQVVSTGASTINGPITISGSAFIQANATGTLTFNGNITESGAFNSGFLFRGTGTHILNSNINLPTAGSTIFVTDGATLLVNTTGNVASSSQSVFGTVRLGINDGLPTAGTLVLGQAGDQVCTVDLNGFNQTVSTLSFAAPTGNLLTKGISNTHPSATSTLTVNQAADTSFNGTFSGRINLVKEGVNSLTLPAAASTFNGTLIVNNGLLVGSSLGNAAGASGCLGAANVAGRQISVNAPGTLSFTSNNIFGNGVGNSNLPTLNITGTTVNSTRYNTVGAVVLNGGTLSQSATDSGAYEGYQFKGLRHVGGATASTISSGNGKANHLDANTLFAVADATASSAPDLVVSNPLRNQSGDFGQLTGGLTKTGSGTMQLAARHHTPLRGSDECKRWCPSGGRSRCQQRGRR
jgi:fibronectin-binding autotransporter adhesin